MSLSSIKGVKESLKEQKIRPQKRLGQNFLINKGAVGDLLSAAAVQTDDAVLEIGPGTGILTLELAKRAKKVIAVEKDQNMVKILKETLKNCNNVEIIRGDIRRSDLPFNFGGGRTSQISGKYKVVGNLPFYLTAPVIRKFLETIEARPQYMVFVVQKEVAQRICAKVPDMNLLAVSVQFYAEPKIISYISKNSFWPSPEVDAAILKISNLKSQFSKTDRDLFFKIVKAGFSQPRKQLANNLSQKLKTDKNKVGEWLLKNNIQPSQRAETLTVKDWVGLTKSIKLWYNNR